METIELVTLPDDHVLVYGSNESAFHGAGAARTALEKYGAVMYSPNPFEGRSYGISTKDKNIRTLPLSTIYVNVFNFLNFAKENLDKTYKISRIGCGLAGLEDKDIAPMFGLGMIHLNLKSDKFTFDTRWYPWLGDEVKYWGQF